MSEVAYKHRRTDAQDAIFRALRNRRGESLAAWARRRGYPPALAYKAVRRYGGQPAIRPRGLETIRVLRDLRADLGPTTCRACRQQRASTSKPRRISRRRRNWWRRRRRSQSGGRVV